LIIGLLGRGYRPHSKNNPPQRWTRAGLRSPIWRAVISTSKIQKIRHCAKSKRNACKVPLDRDFDYLATWGTAVGLVGAGAIELGAIVALGGTVACANSLIRSLYSDGAKSTAVLISDCA
jgi:hypothetical protein